MDIAAPLERTKTRKSMQRAPRGRQYASSSEGFAIPFRGRKHYILRQRQKTRWASGRRSAMRTARTPIGLVFTHNLALCRGVLRGSKEFSELRPGWELIPVAPDSSAVRALSRVK